jgi:hypothetical protein
LIINKLKGKGGNMAEEQIGCAKPTGAVIGETEPEEKKEKQSLPAKEAVMAMAKVGGKAPDFQAPAFHEGKFINIKLSDYLGKWILLCFYPGDFTFV